MTVPSPKSMVCCSVCPSVSRESRAFACTVKPWAVVSSTAIGGVFGPEDTEELLLVVLTELLVVVNELDELVIRLEDDELRDELLMLVRGSDEVGPHTKPVTVGRWTGLFIAPLLPWIPNSTVWPGLIRSFQPTPDAV